MTNIELQIVRRALFLTVKEAVEHIKTSIGRSLSVRAWQLWEQGERPIPSDVNCEMVALAGILEQMKQGLYDQEYVYHRTFEEFSESKPNLTIIDWRMEQAVASESALINIVDNGR